MANLNTEEYDVIVPRKVSSNGQWLSHQLSHHYDAVRRRRRRRSTNDGDQENDDVHYQLELSGREKHLHLKPNWKLLAPAYLVERRGANVSQHRLQPAKDRQCHYLGVVKDHPESMAAISTCRGLVSSLST